MKSCSPTLKYISIYFLTSFFFISSATAHPIEASTSIFGNALMSYEQVSALIIMGVLTAFCMLGQKRAGAVIGSFALLGFLTYELLLHNFGQSLLHSLEFVLLGSFIAFASWGVSYSVIRVQYYPIK